MEISTRPHRRETSRRYLRPTKDIPKSNPSKLPIPSDETTKKNVNPSKEKSTESSTLKKYVDRFRYEEPQSRPERQSINGDLWWLHDELQTTIVSHHQDQQIDQTMDQSQTNPEEFIQMYPSTDIDDDLNARASLLLNQTFSGHSSDLPQISSNGIGSTITSTLQGTISTMQFNESLPRHNFTRMDRKTLDMKPTNDEDDILYQWRLRRRFEQAQLGEQITFPNKIFHQPSPPIPIHFPVVPSPLPLPPPPPPPPPQIQSEVKESPSPASPIRHYSEVSTQTVQDVSIQTSLMIIDSPLKIEEKNCSSSVWHRPPRQKSPKDLFSSPIKRRNQCFRPINVNVNDEDRKRCSLMSSDPIECSIDTTFTQVTPTLPQHSFKPVEQSIDEDHLSHSSDHQSQLNDYSNDQLLNILLNKREELFEQLQTIEQCLLNL